MAKFEQLTELSVITSASEYPIIICRNGLTDEDLLHQLVCSQQLLIVTNKTIAPIYLADLQAVYKGKQCISVVLDDGEEYKNKESLYTIYDALLANQFHRDSTIIALGGGVIGDIAGFAASTYQRGIRLIQIPTTLLAQIDASVGGKTAINHPLGKNMIGSFYQPSGVVVDVNTLQTLPDREFRAGLAEMIKYALLEGGEFYSKVQVELEYGLTIDSPELPSLIAKCCRIKAKYVEEDERETGKRALLNLGHTVGHALEAYTAYKTWLHGEAVAIGLYFIGVLSCNLGLLEEKILFQMKQMIIDAGLPYQIPKSVDIYKLWNLMKLDKKIQKNQLRFVVIEKPGMCYVHDAISEESIKDALVAAIGGE
ncbi:3-dehydroquinate synthase [Legionella waltersii]|uniref:3-dehydroquinate synthase n=1 Tax=Legionella waltersii TaxID=66969 RepID=A0A0W1ANT3_9GAMM|nr:3-dehydroquinate synthase [Legionella waltersii]KTD82926.1 3-dehydroquinate synthase [Legionella waltersii]SNV02337.1 3-dehydroquinate synthase [Legionella waltersii]